jgi:late competence protein required for DNA uptake (superfamily II DNA/RNA helicase)
MSKIILTNQNNEIIQVEIEGIAGREQKYQCTNCGYVETHSFTELNIEESLVCRSCYLKWVKEEFKFRTMKLVQEEESK